MDFLRPRMQDFQHRNAVAVCGLVLEQRPQLAVVQRTDPMPQFGERQLVVVGNGEFVAMSHTYRLPTTAQPKPSGQVPVHLGGRFSANAIAPSLASLDMKTGARILVCSRHISSGDQPRDSTMIFLVAATARGPLAVIFSASSMAASRTLPGSASTLTNPSSCARTAGSWSPVNASSIAIAGGMRCG